MYDDVFNAVDVDERRKTMERERFLHLQCSKGSVNKELGQEH
jgi:hypothetical protein